MTNAPPTAAYDGAELHQAVIRCPHCQAELTVTAKTKGVAIGQAELGMQKHLAIKHADAQ